MDKVLRIRQSLGYVGGTDGKDEIVADFDRTSSSTAWLAKEDAQIEWFSSEVWGLFKRAMEGRLSGKACRTAGSRGASQSWAMEGTAAMLT